LSPRCALGSFAALMAVLLHAPASVAAPVGDCQPGMGWPTALPDAAAGVVERVNAYRAERALAPLAVSPTLTAAAEWKARHMAQYGYMAHDDPAPPFQRTPFERMEACGYPAQTLRGENVAAGYDTPASVMEGWLGSPAHRANLERAEFTAVGVGVARSAAGTHYWAQDFGSVADAGSWLPPAPGLPPAAPPPAPPDTAPQTAPLGQAAAVRVRGCRRLGPARRAVRCRLVVSIAPVTVRARLRQRGVLVAAGRVRSERAGPLGIRMRGRRTLRPGRAILRLQAGALLVRRPVRVR
jgi:uncharacterized protein YkwD